MAIVPKPYRNRGDARLLSEIAASDFAAFVSRGFYRAPPWFIINQRSLDRKLFAIFINDNQTEWSFAHRHLVAFQPLRFSSAFRPASVIRRVATSNLHCDTSGKVLTLLLVVCRGDYEMVGNGTDLRSIARAHLGPAGPRIEREPSIGPLGN
jgi:hypothetical protein